MQAAFGNTASTQAPAHEAAEAARYALLRRLAPSMRHHLVVNLQPIGMIYEVMDRRLRAPQPDLDSVHDSAHKINGFARAALNSCLDVVSWLAPDETVTSSVTDGVKECARLLATSLSFRGYPLRNDVADIDGHVRRSAIRTLLTAAMLEATDAQAPPKELVLTAQAQARGVEIELALRESAGADTGFASESGYRPLDWHDVEALATAEGVEARRTASGISLMIPWAPEG